MKKKLNINRRDFINGFALSLTAGTTLSPFELLANENLALSSAYYPPAMTGMRGSHKGSYEIAHSLAWAGTKFDEPKHQTDTKYDLIVVGGGLSGLSAAYFYRQRYGKDAKILVIDNHDDFGGHAKRNEFTVDGEKLIGYGGSQSIDTPSSYSAPAKKLLKDIGVITERFYDYYDQDFFGARNLKRGLYFSNDLYGKDHVVENLLRAHLDKNDNDLIDILSKFPLANESKIALINLLKSKKNYLQDEPSLAKRIALMRATSYSDFLRKFVEVPEEVVLLYRDSHRGLWGVGWDALSTLEAYKANMPGTRYLDLEVKSANPHNMYDREEPYIFHFPDGNAGVARALVNKLIPDSMSVDTMEAQVKAKVDYNALDLKSSKVRIRLNSSVVKVEHTSNQRSVNVVYINNGKSYRVVGRHVVMACYNNMLPHLCPELPIEQKEALNYATKIPLVYMSIAVRNWRAFSNLGFHSITIPQPKLMHSFGLDFPVSMGDYNFPQNPNQPTILHGTYVPTDPDKGLSAKEQAINGRRQLYEISFAQFEHDIIEQMQGSLKGGGFDAERDIAGITVNRWPHGYAWEYNDYSDPAEYNPYNGPHIKGRARIGRISIANSDASAYAYVDGAIDAADRAVNEQLQLQVM
ncbi:MAG: NAD(P)-binding protein [Woeseiaceae bacterium]|nr:NAD(P)-binding protein [Woeseiaceae bacterium]MDG1015884.1 NAD(P)-binding protein [Woeseiaceae bacterium]MDG1713123.1 NAD(P)-binding protein [Woeseiaceae bacterium]MDG1864859.1 NAD(P)-binding protein [Woeseiaceae bacterium]